MISMVDRLRIHTLHNAGLSLQEVADQVGVSRRSVQNVLKEPAVTSLEDGPTPKSRPFWVRAGRGEPNSRRSAVSGPSSV